MQQNKNTMIELTLNKILIDEKRTDQVVVFREKKGSRLLPLVIGLPEAQSIQLRVREIETPRPMTHDLMASVIRDLGASLRNIVIDRIEQQTFYAKMNLKNNSGEAISIDARPSDCIAIALRAGAPIFVESKVMQMASIASDGKVES